MGLAYLHWESLGWRCQEPVAALLLVARPGAPSSFLLLVSGVNVSIIIIPYMECLGMFGYYKCTSEWRLLAGIPL